MGKSFLRDGIGHVLVLVGAAVLLPVLIFGAQKIQQLGSRASSLRQGLSPLAPQAVPELSLSVRSAPRGYYVPVDINLTSLDHRINSVASGISADGLTYHFGRCVPTIMQNSCSLLATSYSQIANVNNNHCVEEFIGRYWYRIPDTAPIGVAQPVDMTNITMTYRYGTTPTVTPIVPNYIGGSVTAVDPVADGVCIAGVPSRVARNVTSGITSVSASIDYIDPPDIGETMSVYFFGKLTDNSEVTAADAYYGRYYENCSAPGVCTPQFEAGPGGTGNYLVAVLASNRIEHVRPGGYPASEIDIVWDGQPLKVYIPNFNISNQIEYMLAYYVAKDGSTFHAYNSESAVNVSGQPDLVSKVNFAVGLSPTASIMNFASGVHYAGYLAGHCGVLPKYGPSDPDCGNNLSPTPTVPGGPTNTPTPVVPTATITPTPVIPTATNTPTPVVPTSTPTSVPPTVTPIPNSPTPTRTPTPTTLPSSPTPTPTGAPGAPGLTSVQNCGGNLLYRLKKVFIPEALPYVRIENDWTAISGASSYELEKCQGSGCTPGSLIESTALGYDDGQVGGVNGLVFRYRVKANLTSGGETPYSPITEVVMSCL